MWFRVDIWGLGLSTPIAVGLSSSSAATAAAAARPARETRATCHCRPLPARRSQTVWLCPGDAEATGDEDSGTERDFKLDATAQRSFQCGLARREAPGDGKDTRIAFQWQATVTVRAWSRVTGQALA
jgi:hypothetical protein